MAETTCPNCGAKLFPHELRNGECTSCMSRLPASFTAAAPPEPEWRGRDPDPNPIIRRDANAPYRSYDRPSGAGYSMVRIGVNMIRWGMGLLLLLAALTVVGAMVLAAGGAGRGFGGGAIEMLGPLAILVGLAEIALGLILFLGVCFCCTVPAASEGVGWARGLIVCMVLVVVLFIGLFVVNVAMLGRGFGRGRQPEEMMAAILVLMSVGVVASVVGQQLCFCMLLRGVARDFGDRELGGGFLAYFITSIVIPIVLVLGAVVLGAAMYAAGPRGGMGGMGDMMAMGVVVDCVAVVVAIGMFIWMMTLLSRLYNLIPSDSGDRYSYGGRY